MNDQTTQSQQPGSTVAPDGAAGKQLDAPEEVAAITMAAKKSRRILLVGVILLALGSLPGWLLLWQSDKQAQTDANTINVVQTSANASGGGLNCDERLKHYENSFMGIGFCYPASWGEAFVQEGKFEPADTGSRWRLTFSTKDQVTLGLVSPDWTTTVPRDTSCKDPAAQTIPPYAPVSTTWKTEGNPVASAGRGIEAKEGKYRIDEYTADLTTNGVCLTGYTQVGGQFRHAVATYYTEFSPVIVSPSHHIANPNTLITSGDRSEFTAFVKSIQKL